jgi:precorrin-4/cobalt-precorrin-4 C11-methyltransferase
MKRSTLLWIAVFAIVLAGSAAFAQQKAPGKLYVVGMGTAADLITLRGAEVVKKADLIVCETEEEAGWWKDMIGDKELYIAPHAARIYLGVNPDNLTDPAAKQLCIDNARIRQEAVDKMVSYVRDGKTVACLQGGDAMMYGTTWYLEMMPDDIDFEVVPGIGAFQAACAAVAHNPVFGNDTNSVIATMADFPGRVDTNDRLMECQTSMIFYTMHLDYPKLFEQL